MVNRTWLVTVGILSGLVIGASTVKADTDTNVNNEATSAVVTNVNTQNTDKTSMVTGSNEKQQTPNSTTPTTSQISSEQKEQQANNTQTAVTNTDNNVTVSTPKATYYYPNQWYESSDGSWSYFKGDGTRANNEWLWINGAWYYFSGDEMAANGWSFDNHDNEYYFDQNGHYMTNCWHKSESGSWSYSRSDGTRANNEWLWINGAWYYFAGYDMAANGWSFDNHDNEYYFDQNGHYMTNCWHKSESGSWSYSRSDGTRANNEWLWINGAWYYFAGYDMAANGWSFDNHDNEYYFDQNGHYMTNCWHKSESGSWSYSRSDGTRANNEWLWINGAWYYFAGYDMAANGWYYDNHGNQYYFDANGHYAY